MEVAKLLSSVTKSWNYSRAWSAQAFKRKVVIQLLRDREKTLNRHLGSVMTELVRVKVANASLRWSCRTVEDKVAAQRAEVCSPHNAVTESAQLNKTQIAQSVDAAYSLLWKRLIEQAHWTKAQIAIVLEMSVIRADSGVRREDAKSVITF